MGDSADDVRDWEEELEIQKILHEMGKCEYPCYFCENGGKIWLSTY